MKKLKSHALTAFLSLLPIFGLLAGNIPTSTVYRLNERGNLTAVEFSYTNIGNILKIKLNPDGTVNAKAQGTGAISYYGVGAGLYKEGKLKEIAGLKVDYYGLGAATHLQGKLKSIGDIQFTYFSPNGFSHIQGKVKSIGNINIDYNRFGDEKGMIAKIGDSKLTYCFGLWKDTKICQIGQTKLEYYGIGNPNNLKGKVSEVKNWDPYVKVEIEL
ncbi:hypothetical protein [Fulvitalea axinellae]